MSTPAQLPPEPDLVGKEWTRPVQKRLEDWLRAARALLSTQPPSRHASTHRPGNSDALPTGTPVALGTALDTGTAAAFSRSDHVHKRAIETTNGGYVRRRLNFVSGFTVVDDAVNDEIEITATGGGGSSDDAFAFSFFMGD